MAPHSIISCVPSSFFCLWRNRFTAESCGTPMRHCFCSSDLPGKKALYKSQPQDKNQPSGLWVSIWLEESPLISCLMVTPKWVFFVDLEIKKINNKVQWRQINEGAGGLIICGMCSQLGWKQSVFHIFVNSCDAQRSVVPRDLCTQVDLSPIFICWFI